MIGGQLSASKWRQIEDFLPGRAGHVGVTAKDNRNFVNGLLWVLRSGSHWKDLPAEYGNCKSVHNRYTRWARSGLWQRIFQVLLNDSGNRHVMIGSTIVRAHRLSLRRQAASGKGGAKVRLWGAPWAD